MNRKELIEAAIQHVKDVGPNSYEEWVGLIIDFTCSVYGMDPTRLHGGCSPETPFPVPPTFVVPKKEGQP